MLKGLCSAGAQLSHCLGALACQSSGCQARALQCQAMWEHLSSATNAATAVVRNQAITSLEEAHTGGEIDADQSESNQVHTSLKLGLNILQVLVRQNQQCLANMPNQMWQVTNKQNVTNP